jgi:PAS domain S-box-containing protein
VAVASSFLEIAELLPEAMLLVSGEGRILGANANAAKLLAQPAEQLCKSSLQDQLAGDPESVARFLRDCRGRRDLLSRVMLLKTEAEAPLPCRVEGAACGAAESADETIVLRIIPKESATSRFLELTQRIDELTREIARRQQSDAALREQKRTLETVNRIGVTLAAELDLERLMQSLIDAATEVSGAQCGAFFSTNSMEQRERRVFFALSGMPRESVANMSAARMMSLFELTFRDGGVVRIADVLQAPRFQRNTPFDGLPATRPPVRSYMAAPVASREGRLLGGLFFGHWKRNAFNEHVEQLVGAIAAQAAIALDNARLYRALSESESRFRQLADAMPQMVWSARPDGAIDYYNRRWYEFTGLSKAREDDEKWPTILHPDDVERTLELWQEAMRTGDVFETEHRFRDRRTGEYRWHLARALPMRDRSGRITRWFGTSTDIDDLKQAQAALVDASRRKDEFLAMLGHELRNPLSAVVNAMSLLSLPDLSSDDAGQARLIVHRQLQNMTRLIDDLLDVARVTRGKITLQSEVVDLQALMQRVISTVGPLIEARQHRLETSLPGERVRLLADPTRIEQVLNNLLNNAAKYTEAGGHIWLSAVLLGDKVEIRVRDDGLGMNAETLARAFDLFSQAERSLDRSQGGLGIGLTMVKSLVAMHGGEVRAHSDGLGCGSEFIVSFPVLPADEVVQEVVDETRLYTNNSPAPRVLLVEDNLDAALSLRLLLARLGYIVEAVHDGPTALALAAEFQPQIVLLDIGLPEMDGYEVARRLRAQSDGHAPILVALTGYGREEDYRNSREAGFNHHLTKPIQVEELQTMLAELEAR